MKNRIFFSFVFFLLFGTAFSGLAQDVILYGGYVTGEPTVYKKGWDIGLIGRYDFTNKFSQDLGVTYANANFDEVYLNTVTGMYATDQSNTSLVSIRTHSVFNVANTEKFRLSTGIGPCVNFFSTNSSAIQGATNAGLGILVGYEKYKIGSSAFGFFSRVRFEYDPKLSDDAYNALEPFKESMSSIEFNLGIMYTFKNKAE